MGMVMGFTAVILGAAAALIGVMLWTALLFPRPAERARAALERRPWRCFLLGLVLVGILGVPAIAMMNAAHGLIKLAGWVVVFPLVSVLVVGLTAMANLLGERLRQLSPAITPLGSLVRGAITLELALILPIFGWFLFAPLVAITLAGAGAIGCLSGKKDSPRGHGDTEDSTAQGSGLTVQGFDNDTLSREPCTVSRPVLHASGVNDL
jgi:hypothetical protein